MNVRKKCVLFKSITHFIRFCFKFALYKRHHVIASTMFIGYEKENGFSNHPIFTFPQFMVESLAFSTTRVFLIKSRLLFNLPDFVSCAYFF